MKVLIYIFNGYSKNTDWHEIAIEYLVLNILPMHMVLSICGVRILLISDTAKYMKSHLGRYSLCTFTPKPFEYLSAGDMELPHDFHPLPTVIVDGTRQVWPPQVTSAHEVLKNIYAHAVRISHQEEVDALQTAFHIDAISSNAIPLLSSIEQEVRGGSLAIPLEWLHQSARVMGNLVAGLRNQACLGEERFAATFLYCVFKLI